MLRVTVDDLVSPPQTGSGTEEDCAAAGGRDSGLLIRRDSRSLVYNLSSIVKLETIFAGSPNYKLEAMTLTGAKAEYISSKHPHDELGIVARGVLSILLNGEREYILEEGDVLLIPADTEHTIRKVSKEDCVSYWFKVFNGQQPHL